MTTYSADFVNYCHHEKKKLATYKNISWLNGLFLEIKDWLKSWKINQCNGLFPEIQGWLKICKNHIHRWKQNHLDRCRKNFDKIQYSSMIKKILRKLEIKGNFNNDIEHLQRPIANIIFNYGLNQALPQIHMLRF